MSRAIQRSHIFRPFNVWVFYLHPFPRGLRPGMTLSSLTTCRIGCNYRTDFLFCFGVLHCLVFETFTAKFKGSNRTKLVC